MIVASHLVISTKCTHAWPAFVFKTRKACDIKVHDFSSVLNDYWIENTLYRCLFCILSQGSLMVQLQLIMHAAARIKYNILQQ